MKMLCTFLTSLLITNQAFGEAIMLRPGTRVTGLSVTEAGSAPIDLVLDKNRFLLERSDIDRCNLETVVRERCEAAPPPSCPAPHVKTFLEVIGWGGVALISGISLVVGVGVGLRR